MPSICVPSICVFGAGAIGGFLAAKLEAAGTPVSVVARGPHLAAMQARGVPSAIYYPKPLHRQPAYAAAHAEGLRQSPPLPVSETLCHRILSLPMHPYLDENQLERVVAAVRRRLGAG